MRTIEETVRRVKALTFTVRPEGGGFMVVNFDSGRVSHGNTVQEALAHALAAAEIYFDGPLTPAPKGAP